MFAKKNHLLLVNSLILLCLMLLIVSCHPESAITQSSVEEQYLTVAAQTAQVVVTDTPIQLPTLTPTPSTPTATPKSCYDNIHFVADVTIPDGKQIQAGEHFTKIWRMKNNGTCTISPAYDIFFFDGDIMGAPEVQKLVKIQVPPGGTFDVTVDFIAPEESGHYRGYWLIRDIHGMDIGLAGNESFYVDINVIPNPNATPTSNIPTSTTAPPTQDPSLPSPTPIPSSTPTLTLTPTQSIQPELSIMTAVLMPSTIHQAGELVNLVLVIENRGLTASPPFTVKWYANQDTNLLGCEMPVQSMPQTNQVVLNCAYTYSSNQVGTLNTLVVVDELNQVTEADETNNQKQIQLLVVE